MNNANDNLSELQRAKKRLIDEAKTLQTRLDDLKLNLGRLRKISNDGAGEP